MMQFLRSQSQIVFFFIMVVIAASFLLFNSTGANLFRGLNTDQTGLGEIDGHSIDLVAWKQAEADALEELRLQAVMSGDSSSLKDPQLGRKLTENAWISLLIAREADKLHVQVSDDQLLDSIKALPLAKDDKGEFSAEALQRFLNYLQMNVGITPEEFEHLQSRRLRFETTVQTLFGSLHVSPLDIQNEFAKEFGSVTLSIVSFDSATFAAHAQVSEAALENEYKTDPGNPKYRTAEQRQVDYVLFNLTAAQEKSSANDKKSAMVDLGRRANDFAVSLQTDPDAKPNTPQPDFTASARAQNLPVKTSPFFAPGLPVEGLPASPNFNNAAFGLSQDKPLDVVELQDTGYAVIHLHAVEPSQLRPFAEVKTILSDRLRNSQGEEDMRRAAFAASESLQKAMAHGATWAAAVAGLGLKSETVPHFVPAELTETSPAQEQELAATASQLKVGEVSEPVKTSSGLVVAYLESRSKPDANRESFFSLRYRAEQDSELQNRAASDWLAWRMKQPGMRIPKADD